MANEFTISETDDQLTPEEAAALDAAFAALVSYEPTSDQPEEDDIVTRPAKRAYRRCYRILLIGALCVLIPTLAAAQPSRFDPNLALPTPAERHAADVASWATVATAIALDGVSTWKTHCEATWDECEGALVKAGLRIGITFGAAQLAKALTHRLRPCAPACGNDAPDTSLYSMHTAFAAQTIGGPRLAVTLPLVIGTGGLRVAAGKHYLTDTLIGAAAGALVGRLR